MNRILIMVCYITDMYLVRYYQLIDNRLVKIQEYDEPVVRIIVLLYRHDIDREVLFNNE
jgi:hypothetical protein